MSQYLECSQDGGEEVGSSSGEKTMLEELKEQHNNSKLQN
jgi:hypothetical protein